jgi:molybdopterin-guanine dinucleotide biosynthesis protein A
MNAPDSIIVAGGSAKRLGGIDKPMLPLNEAGEPLLVGVIDACPAQVIVVGPKRNIQRKVTWVADESKAGGPAAGIWSGLAQVKTEYVFISAADQNLNSDTVTRICEAAIGNEGAWAIRSDGTGQPLCACVNTDLLRTLLAPTQGINDSPIRLLSTLNMVGVSVNPGQVTDFDTWADIAKVVKGSNHMDQVTQMWLTRVGDLLNVDHNEVPVEALLDITRDVAHGVERKSAPLTTFLIGYAAGKGSLSESELKELIKHVSRAVAEWDAVE